MDDPTVKNVRVRFAPSPTGPFSFGNARTALFNWLFTRRQNGEFLLRFEDTDRERSRKEYEDDFIESLRWLGLNWDGEIYRQSQRKEIYRRYLGRLLEAGFAYYCSCKPEDLELERQSQLTQGLAPRYGGRCRNLKNEKGVIRFKMPDAEVFINDLVRGKVSFKTGLIGDIIIAKSLEEPLYNFAVVVDDFESGISHVIRGEEHLPNTPKQIMIQQALEIPLVQYAHLPLILGADKKKLSKRYLGKSFLDYKKEGYLSSAILNFLVLLGWHPARDREIVKPEEMLMEFSLDRVQKGGAIFNPDKLDWLNACYIRITDSRKLFELVRPFVPSTWFEQPAILEKAIEIERERMKKLSDFTKLAGFLFSLPEYSAELLIWKETEPGVILENLERLVKVLTKNNGNAVMALADKRGRGEVLWPLRVALSGQEASPGPLEIIEILGKQETIQRIKLAIEKLKNSQK
jgi:glutamyl-tRNA synthetase